MVALSAGGPSIDGGSVWPRQALRVEVGVALLPEGSRPTGQSATGQEGSAMESVRMGSCPSPSASCRACSEGRGEAGPPPGTGGQCPGWASVELLEPGLPEACGNQQQERVVCPPSPSCSIFTEALRGIRVMFLVEGKPCSGSPWLWRPSQL